MHPELLSLSLFMLGTSCSPGPNNIVASYSGFNFGVIKTFPHMLGVILGFTTMVCVLNFGLINVFKIYPLLQEILKISGSLFLIYLAYKIAFSKNQTENKKENPVKFFDTFFFFSFRSILGCFWEHFGVHFGSKSALGTTLNQQSGLEEKHGTTNAFDRFWSPRDTLNRSNWRPERVFFLIDFSYRIWVAF